MIQELIERKKALKNICKYCAEAKCKKNECMVFAGIKDTPTAEPEVRNGRWIEKPPYIVCSRCDEQNSSITFDENSVPIAKTFYRTRFCPNCGAKMDLRTPTEVQLDEADDVMLGGKRMERNEAPAEAKPLLDILDHYYGAGPHACKCKHLVDKESIDTIVTALRDVYGIFYQPEPLTLQKDWKAEAVEWKARYEAEREMRLTLQSKVIALNAQLAAEKGILLG